MCNNIIWKSCELGELFERSTKDAFKINQKELNIMPDKDDIFSIALISASKTGSGRVGYIDSSLVSENSVSINKLTFDDQWGFTFFQKEPFVITGGHNAILEIKNEKLKNILDNNLHVYPFLALLINKITIKNGIFGYGYKVNNKLDREVILLPFIETTNEEELISDKIGNYTLAVDYIKTLMDEAKIRREQKTINLYKEEKAHYTNERELIKEQYQEQKNVIVWKKFTLGDLFDFDTSKQLPYTKKELNISEIKDDYYDIAVVTQSEKNNGITGYLESESIPTENVLKDVMIFSLNFGTCFYQEDNFCLLDTHGSIFRLIPKDEKLSRVIIENKYVGNFFSKLIMKICSNGVYNYNWKPNSQRASLEYIVLPCIETNDNNYLWEENNKHFTLAIEYIIYLYLSGKICNRDKLINNYTYQF